MTQMQIEHVNGLPVPKGLLDLIAQGRWKEPKDLTRVQRISHDPTVEYFKLYSLKYMDLETRKCREADENNPNLRAMFEGAPDENFAPGDIDLSKAFFFGDNGIGWDSPYALDYRISIKHPRVLNLFWNADGKWEKGRIFNRWIVIADTIEQFAELIGL